MKDGVSGGSNHTAPSYPGVEPASLNGAESAEMRELLLALQAVRNGDFSVRLPSDWSGLGGKVADTFNEIVAMNQRMSQQLELAGHNVGREGRTRYRIRLGGVDGSWGQMESSVNGLIDDLLWPITEVTRSIEAVAQGSLQRTMRLEIDGRPLEGEFLRTATIVNTMIRQLGVFTSEVTRVAREVGTDGKLGGQAKVTEVEGVWRDLTESVNSMASNLTAQVRNIAEVTIAVAHGDLSKKITVDVRGEILLLKEAINTMVDQLRSFAAEVTRVAREVGTEGRLGGQAVVPGVAGTWKDLTDNVNLLAANLTTQVRNIAEVTTAVARGDLSRKITVDVKGEILELKNTINTMVDQLNAFASEVTRVAREVGTEGRLGGQAKVPGVAGTWKDLTDNVNSMASNLTGQVRNIADVATAIAAGDLSKKITVNVSRRDPPAQEHPQHDGRSAQRVRLGSHARRPRGRHRRPARRTGGGSRRRRHLEGPDRQRQPARRQPDHAGPQHRRSDDRGGARRPVPQDHRHRARRNPGAEEHHQHHGRPAQRLRLGSDARRPRGRHRRQARRPGAGPRRRRHLAGPDRQRQLDGVQPDRPGPQHRRRGDGHRRGRSVEEDRGERLGRDPAAQEHHQHHGGPAQRLRLGSDPHGARRRHRGQARRTGRRSGRRRHLAGPDLEREPARGKPHHPGARHRRCGDRRDQGRSGPLDSGECQAARSPSSRTTSTP